MLPADTGGKINYSPGTFRPVRKFGSCAVWCLSGECTSPRGGVTVPAVSEAASSPHFSPRLDALRGLPEGRGFSPAEIAAPALCWSRAPRSPSADGLRGARDTGIMRKAL